MIGLNRLAGTKPGPNDVRCNNARDRIQRISAKRGSAQTARICVFYSISTSIGNRRSIYAATRGTTLSTKRRNRELRAPATNGTCDASVGPATEAFAFVPATRRDRLLRPPATNDFCESRLSKASASVSRSSCTPGCAEALPPDRRASGDGSAQYRPDAGENPWSGRLQGRDGAGCGGASSRARQKARRSRTGTTGCRAQPSPMFLPCANDPR